MRTRFAIAVALIALTALVSGQTQIFTHPGRLQVRSAASDALRVLGGTVTGGLTSSVVDAGVGTFPILATLGRTGAAGSSTSRGVALAYSDADSATLTAAVVGVRQNSNANYNGDLAFYVATGGASPATSLTVNMTERMRVTSAGQVLVGDGTTGAPAWSFTSDADTGFVRTASGEIGIVSNGALLGGLGGQAITVGPAAYGTGTVTGGVLFAGRNSSGATAPGVLVLQHKGGLDTSIWVDSTGLVRVLGGGSPYENTGDTGGTVVGTQTSTRASKRILAQVNPFAPSAMALIRQTPVYAFTYKNGSFNGETFYGITTDDSPFFGMDRGKSFNPVTAFGTTVLALQDTDRRVAALEAKLSTALAEIERLRGARR